MLCLPHTSLSDDATIEWLATATVSNKMSVSSIFAVEAVLELLSTEDTYQWFMDATNGNISQGGAAIAYWAPRYWAPVFEATLSAVLDPNNKKQVVLSYNDVFCNTCSHYVSKYLDHDHWNDLCGNCSRHSDDCSCCDKCGYEELECMCCGNCGEAPGWCYCCSHCGYPEADCECRHCEECGTNVHYCSCDSGGGSVFGSSKTPPWVERDNDPILGTLPKIADCDNKNIDPVQAAANFYLLDAIKNGVRFSQVTGANEHLTTKRSELIRQDNMLSALTVSATREYERLVEYLAPNFLAYAIAAVGGELRYHRACGKGVLTSSRDTAWDRFVDIVQEKGAETLFEANDLFCEFNSSSYGGKKWGNAAKVVGQYLKGTMPAWLFVDRVFTLQHNGGCFLNKVAWQKKNKPQIGLSRMMYILNAHAADETDWDLLLEVASPEVATMFRMADRAINRLSKRFGGQLPPVRRSSQRYVLHERY